MEPTTTAAGGPHTLPVQLTAFIGREREIAAVRQALAAARLLTLTGAGGSGKTRLAVEVAARAAAEHPDGVAWAELATLSDPGLLPQQLASAVGVREEGGRSALTVLSEALRNRSLLLVLDNCEHLADACAALVDALLRACPHLRILATSREALGVAGERAWLVPPLSLPEEEGDAVDRSASSDAVQLFVARAQDVQPSFALTAQNAPAVVQICRRLDGIPLAIELAAARAKVLTPEQIAGRLDNAFALLTSGTRTALPRHRTLRAAIDWSYQLLSEPEQLLLQRLSVFSGGFTLEAAESVCADERLQTWEVLDQLARLVDRSMVVMREQEGAARYHLLETVRQYAAEWGEASGAADAVRRRHAHFFLAMAEAAAPHVYMGGSDPAWLHGLDAEVGNLRTAADSFEAATGEGDAALRLVTALHWYWYQRDPGEGRQRADRALERPGGDPAARGRVLMARGALAFWQGDLAALAGCNDDAIPILRATGQRHELGQALNWSALGLALEGKLDEAWHLLEEALPIARVDGGGLHVQTVSTAGHVAHRRGDLRLARSLADEAVRIGRRLGLAWAVETITINLGRVAFDEGDLAGAAAHWREVVGSRRSLTERWAAPFACEGLAVIAAAQGEDLRAAVLLGAADMIRERLGTRLRPWTDVDRPVVEDLRRRLGEAEFQSAVERGRRFSVDEALAYALGEPQADDAPHPPLPQPPPATQPLPAGSGLPAVPPTLRVLALGPLEIQRAGRVVTDDEWRYSRPRELLLYLLAHPEGRTREQIGLVFWPDSSPAQVKNSFHVTLHHLRKVLGGAECIVFQDERYRINPELRHEFDAAIFEREMAQALREARAGDGSAERLRGVLALYRGDFLEHEAAGDWHLEPRDHLRRLYLDGLLALGELLMQAGAYPEAAEVHQRLVRREELHEEAHRRLMLCLAQAGERTRALRQYERLTALLREELDAAPEPETTALFDRLRQAQPV
jgi:predicted ATPase/DNA-binding SARP family transcriptional activator